MAKFIFMGCKITVNCGYSHEIAPWKESYGKPRQHIKKQRHYFANKGPYSQSYGYFQESCMEVRVGPQRRLSIEELMLLNCGVGEDS